MIAQLGYFCIRDLDINVLCFALALAIDLCFLSWILEYDNMTFEDVICIII